MTMFELLGVTSWADVGPILKKQYIQNAGEQRRQRLAKRRDDFYRGNVDAEIDRLIHVAFVDDDTRKLRAELIEWSKWNNLVKRIVDEKATVYSEPAARKVANDDERYQEFLSLVQLDGSMREVNRKMGLHEDALVMYRVRVTPRGRQPVIDIVSPASFWAISHPNDPTMLVGVILDQRRPDARPTDRAYRVWTDDETFMLDAECRVMEETHDLWPLGRLPGVLASTSPPGARQTLLAAEPSADLIAAQTAVCLQSLLLLKESKSANRQTYVTGDTKSTPMGQSGDSEREVMLGEGVNVQTLDRGMDLEQFRLNSGYISDEVGANHGVPPSIRKQDGATSGAELHLRRLPLYELRRAQIVGMRRVELELAQVMALVNSQRIAVTADEDGAMTPTLVAGDLQDFAFSAEGFSIDYGEIEEPLTAAEKDAVYDERRRLLLTDGIAEERKRNPDIRTDDDAMAAIAARVERQTKIVALTKDLQALNGSTSTAVGEATAAENGAQGPIARDAKKPDGTLRSGSNGVTPMLD